MISHSLVTDLWVQPVRLPTDARFPDTSWS